VIKRGFIILCELEKIFCMFTNNIYCLILVKGEMRFEKSFKLRKKKPYLLNMILFGELI